jgi:hypothetical protein
MNKIVLIAIVLVVAAAALWYFKMNKQNSAYSVKPTMTTQVDSSSNAQATPLSSAKTAVTDQSLDLKFQAVQGGLTKLDTDQKATTQDSSLQDTPGNY